MARGRLLSIGPAAVVRLAAVRAGRPLGTAELHPHGLTGRLRGARTVSAVHGGETAGGAGLLQPARCGRRPAGAGRARPPPRLTDGWRETTSSRRPRRTVRSRTPGPPRGTAQVSRSAAMSSPDRIGTGSSGGAGMPGEDEETVTGQEQVSGTVREAWIDVDADVPDRRSRSCCTSTRPHDPRIHPRSCRAGRSRAVGSATDATRSPSPPAPHPSSTGIGARAGSGPAHLGFPRHRRPVPGRGGAPVWSGG